MLDLIVAGGWLMIPIIACSIVGLGIIVERFWTLRISQVAPRDLLPEVRSWLKNGELSRNKLETLYNDSPLGRILATGLANSRYGRDIMKESIEETAGQVVHGLGRFLNMLSTIAEIAPLLGLLGTVDGMIQVFATIFANGNGDIEKLSGGISVALITTAAGLIVAIPTLFFHRFLIKRVEEITVTMEQDAIHLVDLVQGKRAPQNTAEQEVANQRNPATDTSPTASAQVAGKSSKGRDAATDKNARAGG